MLTPALPTQKSTLAARDDRKERHPQPRLQLWWQQRHTSQPALSPETPEWKRGAGSLSPSESSGDLKRPALLAWATGHMRGSQRLLPWAVTNTAGSERNRNTELLQRDKMTNKQTELFNSKLFGRANHQQGRIHSHNLKGKITSSYRKSHHCCP